MSALEQEIIEKFHLLDKAAQQRVREVIEREIEAKQAIQDDFVSASKRESWRAFINATYGSLADNPLDEINNDHLPPPIRDEVE